MSTPLNAQAVTCPHCKMPIASGALLASHADGLWKAIVAALAASDLPADVPRAAALDLSAELGAAYWTLDCGTYRFVPAEKIVQQTVKWRVFFQCGAGALDWSVVDCSGDWSGTVRHGEAAIGVVQHYIRRRLMARFWGRGNSDSPAVTLIPGSGTYAP